MITFYQNIKKLSHLYQNCRVSDRGGGIPHHIVDKVVQYNFTTASDSDDATMDNNVMGNMMQLVNQKTSGPMHG